jgi:uncharacterized cupin superfamily protein
MCGVVVDVERMSDQVVRDTAESTAVIKARLEELALVEFRYSPGRKGPERHVHDHHTDAFYVLDGELTVEAGEEILRVAPGGFVAAPAGVAHTFRNESSADARFLNIHAPSMGFHDYLLGNLDDFDQRDPPPDGGRPSSDSVIRPPGEGDTISMGPGRALFKAEGKETEGTFSLTETTITPGFPGPVRHVHRRTVDSFYVLEGELSVILGEEQTQLGPGGYALVAPGTAHTFSNSSQGTVRMLNLMAPGGFEQYLKEMAAATPAGSQPEPALMARIASKYDFEPA